MSTPEPLHDIAHLGSIELLTPQPQRSLWFFRDVLGMEVVHETAGSVYLRSWGDFSASTLKLTAAPASGVGCVAWRTTSPSALERRSAALKAAGLGIDWSNGDYGRGRSFRLRDPDGHVLEIYYEEQKYAAPATLRSALKNQPQKYTGRGVGVRRTDHVVLMASDVAADRRFAEDLLGFQVREQVIFEQGTKEIGAWMSPNAVHHQLAYVTDVKGGRGRLHHISLWVDNREDVLRAADILTENGIFIEAGPAKHNNGQGFYLYSYEPGGNRVEIYSGSYLVLAPDWQPVTWDEVERGTGTYWGGTLPASFLQYATPDIEGGEAGTAPKLPVFF